MDSFHLRKPKQTSDEEMTVEMQPPSFAFLTEAGIMKEAKNSPSRGFRESHGHTVTLLRLEMIDGCTVAGGVPLSPSQ